MWGLLKPSSKGGLPLSLVFFYAFCANFCAAVSLRGQEAPADATDDVEAKRFRRLEAQIAAVPFVTQQMAQEAEFNLLTSDADTRFAQPGDLGRHYLPGVRVVYTKDGQLYYRPVPERMLAPSGGATFDNWEASKPGVAMYMAFLAQTVARHKVPPFDVTFDTSDYCRDKDTGKAHFVFTNTTLRLSSSSIGSQLLNPTSGDQLPPVFTWNSRPACGAVAVPTGYDWLSMQQSFADGSPWRADSVIYKDVPWDKKKPKVLWRGGILSWDGSRSRGLRLGLLHPELLDIKVPWVGHQHLTSAYEDCGFYERDLKSKGLTPARGAKVTQEECGEFFGDFMNMSAQKGYRYLLDMDGAGTTFRLKNLLLTGSLVFRVQSGAEQFFFQDLVPFEHFVPVDGDRMEEDLVAKVQWAVEHDDKARRIAENAMVFAKKHLRTEDAQSYLAEALKLYSARLNFSVAAPPGFLPFCCDDLSSKWSPKGYPPFFLLQHCTNPEGSPSCTKNFTHSSWFQKVSEEISASTSSSTAPPTAAPTVLPHLLANTAAGAAAAASFMKPQVPLADPGQVPEVIESGAMLRPANLVRVD